QREVERIFSRRSKSEDRLNARSSFKESRTDHTRRIVAHLIDALAEHNPVVVDADATANGPIPCFGRIPSKPNAWAPKLDHGIGENAAERTPYGVCDLIVKGAA